MIYNNGRIDVCSKGGE